jgi:hypothetical protein
MCFLSAAPVLGILSQFMYGQESMLIKDGDLIKEIIDKTNMS